MPNIRLKCKCGARLKVPEMMGGGSIRCWHCGAKLAVPRSPIGITAAAGMIATIQKPWIRVTCECKKVVKAPPDWVGKQGHCPRCGKELLMIADVGGGSSTGVEIPNAKNAESPHVEMFDGKQPEAIPRDLSAAASLENSSLIAELDMTGPGSIEILLTSGIDISAVDNDKTVTSVMKDMDATQVSTRNNDLPPMPNAPPPPSGALGTPGAGGSMPKTAVGPARAKAQIAAGFLRVECVCGKVVKAPIEWAGTVGNCPRCGKSIVMPAVDPAIAAKIRSQADAMEAAKPAPKKTGAGLGTASGLAGAADKTARTGGTPLPPTKGTNASGESSMMDSILNSENTATLSVEGIEAQEWEKRKMARAAQRVKSKDGLVGSIMFNLKHSVLGGGKQAGGDEKGAKRG